MDREIKLARDAASASRAQSLIDDELLNKAFETLEQEYIKAWRTSGVLNEIGREKLFIAINVIGKVRTHLENVLANGKLASHELEELSKKSRTVG